MGDDETEGVYLTVHWSNYLLLKEF